MTTNLMQVRLHVDTARTMAPVFRIEEPLYLEALKRFPDLKPVLKTTIGHDLEGFEEALAQSDAIVAWKFAGRIVVGVQVQGQSPLVVVGRAIYHFGSELGRGQSR